MVGQRTFIVQLSADISSLALFLAACDCSRRFHHNGLFKCLWVLVDLAPHCLNVLQSVAIVDPYAVEDLSDFSERVDRTDVICLVFKKLSCRLVDFLLLFLVVS